MKMVRIRELGRDVSCLGMGSMIFAPERKGLVFELLDRFGGHGGNLIDSSEVYGGGKSELAIGLYMAERNCRKDWVILDKGCAAVSLVTTENIRKAIAGNLQRLGTDYIDLWVAHRDNPAVPVGDIVETLNDEVAKGRIRAFGGSNWSAARIREANEYAAKKGLMGMAVSSPHVCLATAAEPFWADCTQASEADIAWHAASGVPLVAWSSQARGFFLDTSGPDETNADLRRVYHPIKENFEKLARARALAKAKGVATIQIALAYVLNLPAPMIALVGPATPGEVDSCAAAADLRLTQAEMDWLALRRSAL
ncbi:MAG: aldo/keto reductase [Planctomycetes bacterium]|nr:aldo/keto reductase [Planctomycetota bacterium]